METTTALPSTVAIQTMVGRGDRPGKMNAD